MEQALVMDLAQNALMTILTLCAPMLGLGLLVGLVISIFQATTQIHEQTLTFIPKILVLFGSIIVLGPWMITTLVNFTENLFVNIERYIR